MKAVNYKGTAPESTGPKEFACRNVGMDCSWKHVARTEDLLLDAAALHLRDIHGVASVGTDMAARIRRAFTNPSRPVPASDELPQMKEFRCRDIGTDCSWRYLAQTEELIVDGAAVHAREAHGIAEFSPEMIARVKKAIRSWGGEKAAA